MESHEVQNSKKEFVKQLSLLLKEDGYKKKTIIGIK